MTKYVGDTVRFTATFNNDAGAAADPGTITFNWLAPNLTETTLVHGTHAAVIKESTGVYHCDFLTDQVGVWEAEARGTTPIPKTTPARWVVEPTL